MPKKGRSILNLHLEGIMAKRSQQRLTSKDYPAKSKVRFDFTLDDNDFEEFTRGYVPPNTSYDTQKCVKLFIDWRSARNALFPDNLVPDDILVSENKEEICKWLCKFMTDVRKKDGQPYHSTLPLGYPAAYTPIHQMSYQFTDRF